MKVFKFGGASVKDAAGVRNVAEILKKFKDEKILVVVSAMAKTTNELEKVAEAYFHQKGDAHSVLQELKDFHENILNDLFQDKKNPVFDDVNNTFVEVEWAIEEEQKREFDFEYDQIVSIGELVATKIVATWLKESGVSCQWKDARDFIKTDNTYREGTIDWEETEKNVKHDLLPFFEKQGNPNIVVTQGFIGATSENFTTTLGREGSDYTAAIFAYCLDAESVTIWKDVPGVLNADPKYFKETIKFKHISYRDAIELAYYGATVIHPKTIQPLQNKGITLYVKSFVHPEEEGTIISPDTVGMNGTPVPSYIFKMNQVLISISPKDFSFIIEDNLTEIFGLFSKHKVKINVMQNTAVSFSVSADQNPYKIPALLEDLSKNYRVLYNEDLQLITIRHYDQLTIDMVTLGKEIILELKSRNTVQMVVRDAV